MLLHVALMPQFLRPSSTIPIVFCQQGQKLGAEYEVTLLRPQLQGVKVRTFEGRASACNNWGTF